MPFGQQSGPPASAKQLAFLRSLLKAAGHDDFRTARHQYGLTQRQASGKFSVREASELIDRLQGIEPAPAADEPALPLDREGEAGRADDAQRDAQAILLRGVPADLLAAELQRRGWTVASPD